MTRSFFLLLLAVLTLIGCQEVPSELMTKEYTKDQLMTQICSKPKQCAETPSEIWFIDQGFLFSYNKMNWMKSYKDRSDVKIVLNYKQLIVGVQVDGDIYIAAKTQDGNLTWHSIGNSISDIFVINNDLVALNFKRELWKYKGSPGELIWTYIPIMTSYTISCGQNCTTTVFNTIIVPTVVGREIALEDTGVSDIKSVQNIEGDLKITLNNSSILLYSQLPN